MQIKKMVVASSLVLAAVSAHAGEWYGVASVGQSSLPSNGKSDTDNALRSLGATGLSSSMDDSDTGYKLQLGYAFNKNWAVEGGYVDLGKFNYRARFTGGTANADIKATGWNVGVIGSLPVNDYLSVFAKAGFIDAKVEANVTATGAGGSASGSASDTSWKGNWGVGASYEVNKNIAVRAEWERFNKLGDNNNIGESDVDLVSFGVVYKF